MATCPDCDAPLPQRKKFYIGQLIICPECGASLEIVNLKPLEVDYYMGDEDWEEEE